MGRLRRPRKAVAAGRPPPQKPTRRGPPTVAEGPLDETLFTRPLVTAAPKETGVGRPVAAHVEMAFPVADVVAGHDDRPLFHIATLGAAVGPLGQATPDDVGPKEVGDETCLDALDVEVARDATDMAVYRVP